MSKQEEWLSLKKNRNNYWRKCGEMRILKLFWQICKMVHLLWEIGWQVFKKLNIELAYDPARLFLGTYQRDLKHMFTQRKNIN